MAKVALFTGITEVTIHESEPEKPDLDPRIAEVLMRYQYLGAEIKHQHSSTLSFDLHLETNALHRLTDEILN